MPLYCPKINLKEEKTKYKIRENKRKEKLSVFRAFHNKKQKEEEKKEESGKKREEKVKKQKRKKKERW